jgi:ABC-type branched-subunit amino acid transport system permease subunit
LHGLRERMTDVERAHPVLAHDHGRLQHLGEFAQLALGAEYAAAHEDRGVAGSPEQSGGTREGVWVRLWRWDRSCRWFGGNFRRTSGRNIGRNLNHHRSAAADYWIFLALAVAVIGVIVLLLRTRYGLALQAIRDNETAAKSNGIDVNRARMVVFVVAAAATAMVGSMVFLQKLSITPFSAFSINDWTVNMIFITVIGGIGRVEGPILGTVIFFVLREFLADLASTYLIILGVVAIGVMLKAPKGIWGYAADRLGWQLFPLARHLVRGTAGKGGGQALRIGAAGRSNAPSPTEPVRGLP